jgi:hypothetical protein
MKRMVALGRKKHFEAKKLIDYLALVPDAQSSAVSGFLVNNLILSRISITLRRCVYMEEAIASLR